MYRLMWKNLITPANDFKSDSSPVSPELFNQKQLVEEFWKYPPQHLEETGLESNSKLFLGIGILLDWLHTDYRELQYFYFFKYFGHFLCLQNRIFFSSDSIWKKGFSSWSCRGWCIFFLVGKSSTQKKVQKGLHTYAHDTIVDFLPGIMIDPFYEWSSITGLTVYNQSFLAHSFWICQFCLILFGINLRNGEPCSVWSKAKRLAAKDSKRCDLHSTITYNT